jgi:hypothetical protein
MNARIVIGIAATIALACNGAGANGSGPSCGAPAVLFSGLDSYDSLVVQNGFVYVELPGEGVQRCAVTGCSAPSVVVDTPAFVSSALGATDVAYTTQIASADGDGVDGEMHAVGDDGTGDQSVATTLVYPEYVAVSGTRTFWAQDSFAVDDTPATINCVGCSGTTSTQWFAGLTGGTYGMIADANSVYVLADDPTQTSITLFACRVDTPCYSEPRVVIAGLDSMMTAQRIASDGTNAYVARANDIVRVDASGNVTTLVTTDGANALVVDVANGDLYYGTTAGFVGRVKTDGSTQPQSVGCVSTPIAALDVDDTSVYMLAGESSTDVLKAPKPE